MSIRLRSPNKTVAAGTQKKYGNGDFSRYIVKKPGRTVWGNPLKFKNKRGNLHSAQLVLILYKMPRNKASFVIACSFLFVAVVVFFAFGRGLRLQAQSLSENSGAAEFSNPQQNIVAPEMVKTLPANSVFISAAEQNINLKTNINWAFGGKVQRGWYLYESLINQLISNDSKTDADFAAALSRWQQTAGLASNGVLDETTLFGMVKTWQSNRLKIQGYPSADALMTAPASEFWDETRPAELRQIERETYAAYKKMIAAAAADKTLNLKTTATGELAPEEKFLKIVSSFRSREYQKKLRAASPNSGRAGLAVNSPHFTGRALDIYVGGEPVSTKDENRFIQVNTPVYKWLVKNAEKFGFKPYFYEPWHWEYAPVSQSF